MLPPSVDGDIRGETGESDHSLREGLRLYCVLLSSSEIRYNVIVRRKASKMGLSAVVGVITRLQCAIA